MPRNSGVALPQPVFNEGNTTRDPTRFSKPHPSDNAQYKLIRDLLKKDVVGFDASRAAPDALYTLQEAYGPHGPEIVQRIKKAGKLIFHCAGDTGASSQGKYNHELSVADQMTADCRGANEDNRPHFLYHLGDVVYSFGESRYYYDQFYEPFRDYPGPIFAVPGNHDSFVLPGTPAGETPLEIFKRNFCAQQPTLTVEAGSLHRTAMTQPGVYFALDAPFVRILGLFSNALEDPGIISSESGRWPGVPDVQLQFLQEQLRRIRRERFAGAVLLAVHHPPFSYSPPPRGSGTKGQHGGSPKMLEQIDTICKAEGVYPHAVLSGHAHNMQRYDRRLRFGGADIEVPFVVAGDSGHNVNRLVKGRHGQPAQEPHFNADVAYLDRATTLQTKGLRLKHYDDINYGYLRITADATKVAIGFHEVGRGTIPQSRVDTVTVDLRSHKVIPS
jgi:hypothetical protein